MALFGLAAAWWFAAFGVMLYQTSSDERFSAQCYFSTTGRVIQLILGLAGSGFSTWMLYRPPAQGRIWALLATGLFVAWLLVVFVVLPTLPHYCEN